VLQNNCPTYSSLYAVENSENGGIACSTLTSNITGNDDISSGYTDSTDAPFQTTVMMFK